MNKIKVIIFSIIFVAICLGVNTLLSPVSATGTSYHDTCSEFYSLPKNSVETLFIGPSTVLRGIIPTRLYQKYGISSYNLGGNNQPALSLNAWIREAYNANPDYLKNVVLEVSNLTWGEKKNTDTSTKAALLEMRLSFEKLKLIRDYAVDLDEFVSLLFPTVSYHTLWKKLNQTDILNRDMNENYLGYGFNGSDTVFATTSFDKIDMRYRALDPDAKSEISDFNMYSIKTIMSFCADKNLNLIFYVSPRLDWTSGKHNVVQSIADNNNIKLIDFNFGEPYEKLNFSMASDAVDNKHANYYGAVKITDYIGEYMAENCVMTDVRGDKKFAFLEEESELFSRGSISIELNDIADPAEYISYAAKTEDMAVVISVKGDAAKAMTEAQRAAFEQLGFKGLSDIKSGEPYIGVLYNGEILCDMTSSEFPTDEADPANAPEPLQYTTNIGSGCIVVKSGGKANGDVSSLKLNGTEYSSNANGINILLYDRRTDSCAATAVFDTGTSAKRIIPHLEKYLDDYLAAGKDPSNLTGLPNQLYLYNLRYGDFQKTNALHRTIGENDLLEYIDAFKGSSNCTLILCANASSKLELTPEIRKGLAERGLNGLAEKTEGDNYVGAVHAGNTLYDELGKNGEKAELRLIDILAYSTNDNVVINHKRMPLAINSTGLNIVVFNYKTQLVVDRVCFKSGEKPEFAK